MRADPRAVTLWRLDGALWLLLFYLPVLGGAATVASAKLGALALIPAALLACLGAAYAFFWPGLTWARLRYEVREHDLLVEQGVLFRQRVSVPLRRIQHVGTRQGPLERALGLARLTVYTAAGIAADAWIEGLSLEVAEALRDQLARRSGDDGV